MAGKHSLLRSNPVNTDNGGGGIESVLINGMSVLSRLNEEKI